MHAVAPLSAANWPAGHVKHCALPFTLLYDPAAHGGQAAWPTAALLKDPAGHAEHVAGDDDHWPSAHCVQPADAGAEKDPASQRLHTVDAGCGAKNPDGQLAHDECGVDALVYLPAPHAVHAAAPVLLK